MHHAMQNLKLGGLGANIGSEDWEKARKKQEFFTEYGKQIRMQNLNKQMQGGGKKREGQQPKEMSKREKALEFASRVPKPKIKPKD